MTKLCKPLNSIKLHPVYSITHNLCNGFGMTGPGFNRFRVEYDPNISKASANYTN